MTKETNVNRNEGSSTISRRVTRCYECEIIFEPKNTEICCPDCSKGTRPFINHTADHFYLKNMQSFSDKIASESSVVIKQNQPPLAKRSITDVGTNKVKRIKLMPDESWQFKNGDVIGSNGKKIEKSVTHLMTATGTKAILNVSLSNANIKQIHYTPLSKNLSRLCEKSSKTCDQDVSQQGKELLKWNRGVIDSKGEAVVSTINNFKLVPLNQKSGYANLELTALRAEEKKLEELIISCSSDSDEVLSVQKMRRISELESKRIIEEELLASKEEQVKSLERQASQSKFFVDTSKEERDSLSNSVKESNAALELALSSASAAENDVSIAIKKLDAVTDEDFKIHLRHALALKDERAAVATKAIVSARSQLRQVEKNLQDAEDEFKTKDAAYQGALEQVKKAELNCLKSRDNLTSIDQELAPYYSQLKSLKQDNYRKGVELKKKLLGIKCQIEKKELLHNVDIKYDQKREELDIQTKFVDRFLSLTQ